MRLQELKKIFAEIKTAYANLRAEIIIAEIEKQSQSKINVLINNNSTFSRSFRRDVIKANLDSDKETITLNLSRNGIYDSLPEGLFHEQYRKDKTLSYAARHKLNKKEEKEARLFFSPIENEFFNQRLHIEKNEQTLLNNFYNLEDDFLIEFWDLDTTIPRKYLITLIKLLPYCFKISGDLELTKLSLEKIINQKVTFTTKYISPQSKVENITQSLGVDMVTQSTESEILHPYLEIEIGPIEEENIEEYVNNIAFNKFLNTFYNFFIPIELEVQTKFKTKTTEKLTINKGSKTTIMGVTTRI